MRSKSQQAGVGRHRKITPSQTAKGRIALFTVAAGAVSSAGVSGATAASVQSESADQTKAQAIDLNFGANLDADQLLLDAQNAAAQGGADAGAAAVADSIDDVTPELDVTPQILAISDAKPVTNLSEQLNKAVEASAARAAADQAARAPQAASPADGIITSGFGPRWGSFHAGIDIANANGTPIRAVEDGVVIDAGYASGYGQWVRLQHADGTVTIYGHVETIDVSMGQHVTAGQKIAGMGNLGFSTGTHLHFQVEPAGMGPVDPIPWLAERGVHIG